MSDQDYAFYQKFTSKAQMDDLVAVLDSKNIPYQVNQSKSIDTVYTNTDLGKGITVYLRREDFEKANQAYEEAVLGNIEHIDPDYYLFQFEEEELLEIVHKPDEWGAFDRVLAKRILRERGVEITDEMADELYQQRLKTLAKPSKEGSGLVMLGYLLAFAGGLGGTFIGWHLFSYKKTLPNGTDVYVFHESVRKDGKTIFYISLVVLVISIAVYIMMKFG
jgi:tetratricopeptide (TPR) repeat protein